MPFSPDLYRHELDQKAFDELHNSPDFIKLRESYIAHIDEKTEKNNFLSSAIRIDENQLPEIYFLLPPICEKLGIAIPELYYIKSEKMNTVTGGNTSPYIFITSELVEKLPTDLIGTMLAHECGHLACQHYCYRSMANQLIDGVDKSPLSQISSIRRYLTPTLVRELLFWNRCSELSADRAAVLCDGTADKIIEAFLRINGYENISRVEFLRQSMDLKAFVNDWKPNKLIEQIPTQDEIYLSLASRVYELHEWTKTAQFQGLIDGTYTVEEKQKRENKLEEREIIVADLTVESSRLEQIEDIEELNNALDKVNAELERYINKADKGDYAFAILSGIITGVIDAIFVGSINIGDRDIALSHQQVNNFIQKYASERGFKHERLRDAIRDLENAFKVKQDNVWKGASIGVSAKNHHLADLAHHPTPLGLVSSIIVQFLRIGIFVNKNGEWHFKLVETSTKDIVDILVPAVITGMLNWLVYIAEKKYEQNEGNEVPVALHKLVHLVASTPMIIELAKCADNWFGHLVSDMGGSKNTAGGGMGIPGVLISLLYEFSALPVIKDTKLPFLVNELYEKQKIDFRHEISLYKTAGKQAILVAFNEIFIRVGYFVSHLAGEIAEHHDDMTKINWRHVVPFYNRTVDRMLAVASLTFTIADTTDAAIHAAIESGGNWVLFSGRFVTRYNYVGAGRATVSIIREIANERKEIQLIHEKMILSEEKAVLSLSQLQQFKNQLEEKVSQYLAEDIESFMCGFEYIKQGFTSGDSDLVIKGNIIIQRVLGRELQFKTQKEFDDLMESEIPLVL